ncbi:thiol reductant ABC exporter subunit CydC [Acetobacteraceae bacterium KSS8]|uniref:Thiol reductant ABC exporter subunit CydC n=1 Tax=Endosaccharibacter trunci TaxID=2812733 RepID=A0ABT1W6J3_9PROT|nr:thiol reductant ABC exporter subunit CydC [Acetobacteraceae bacterium KSS8]
MSRATTERPGQAGIRPVLRILGLWRAHAVGLAIGVILSLLAFVAGLALLAASGSAVAGTGVGLVLASALLLRLFGAGRVVLRYLERLATHDATFRALADLRVWFFRGVAARSSGGLGFRRSGDLLSRLVGDVEALDGLYLRIIVPLAGAIIAVPLLFILAERASPVLAIVLVALLALAAFVLPYLAGWLVSRDSRALSGASAALRIAVLDLVSGLREVRAFNAERRMLAGVQGREAELLAVQHRLSLRTAIAGAASFLCQQLAILAVLAALTGLVFARVDPIAGTIVLFVLLASFELVGGLTRAGALAGNVANAAERVLDARAPALDGSAPAGVKPAGTAISFRDVGFRWLPGRPAVFEHLTLDIQAGSRVAILGPSGSGKSSLAALLLRVVPPQHGQITMGGVDLQKLDETELRSRVAWLSQATHLFADTIRANLLLGRPDATDTELWQALDQAMIGDVVRAMPDGLDTWLGEGGSGFSGGQQRRLALARTLVSTAPILILDEPAAGLDAETERAFLQTLNGVAAGRTVILIAHRLTGVEVLDRIWRLAGGHASAAAA